MKTLKFVVAGLFISIFMVLPSISCAENVVQVTNTPNSNEECTSIVVFNNVVYAIWWVPATKELYFDKSVDGGATWGQYRKVIGYTSGTGSFSSSKASPKCNKILADKDGNLFILYNDADTLRLLKSMDGGENFINFDHIDSPLAGIKDSIGYFDFAINETGNIIYVLIIADFRRGFGLVYKRIVEQDSFFKHIKNVSLSYPGAGFSMTAGQGNIETDKAGENVYLFFMAAKQYMTSYTAPSRLLFTRSQDGGASFETVREIYTRTSEHSENNLSTAMGPDGSIYAARDIYGDILLAESHDKGATFYDKRINDGVIYGEKPSVCVNTQGKITVAFYRHENLSLKVNQKYSVYVAKEGEEPDTYVYGPLKKITDFSRPGSLKLSTQPDGKSAFLMWGDYPTDLDVNKDLYGISFISDGPRPLPDLTIGDITYRKNGDGEFFFTVPIKNIGTAPAVGQFWVSFSCVCSINWKWNTHWTEYASIDGLAAGETKNVTIKRNPIWPNTDAFDVKVDALPTGNVPGVIQESNENNNNVFGTLKDFENEIPPDLKIGTVTYTPKNPKVNRTVTFTVPVKNIGAGDAENFILRFLGNFNVIYDEGVENIKIDKVKAGQTKVLTIKKIYKKKGVKAPYFHADFFDSVAETNEKNNSVKLNIRVK
jgi:hypothetical protein